MKKGVKTISCLLVAVVFIMPIHAMKNEVINATTLNNGWLEERDGVKILHINGSNYDMGYQHGYLLKDEIEQNYRAFSDFFDQVGWDYLKLLEIWDVMKYYLPQEYIEEMQGMADGSDMEFEKIVVLHTMPAVINLISCWGLAAWGPATADGTLVHVRSLDGIFNVKDPVSDTRLHDTQVLIIRNPENGYASMCPQFSGDIGCWGGGINEMGIGIGELSQWCQDTTFHGINGAFRMRMVMDYASSAEEALDIMNSNRTCGWNFIVSDSKIPAGFIIEQTANLVYVGEWMNPTESTQPFWAIENVVRRGNLFISPLLADVQRDRYDPSGFIGFILLLLGQNSYFIPWSQYKAISEEIEKQWGTLDLNSTMSLIRDVYLGNTDPVFNLMQKIGSYVAAHQWVASPETGDMVIAFAEGETLADRKPVHYFNLFDLLEAEPP